MLTNKGPRLEFAPHWPTSLRPGGVGGMSGGPAVVLCNDEVFWFGIQSAECAAEGKTPSKLFIAEASAVVLIIVEWLRRQHEKCEPK